MLFIFDMGGVVTNTFKMDSLYNELNLQSKDFFSICKINDVWEQFELGKLSSKDFWQTFNELICKIKKMSQKEQENLRKEYNLSLDLDFSKIPVVETDLFRLYFHPTRQKKTVELIQKLKEKHRVVCGTNTNQSHWENHLECGDYAFFNQTYASNIIGIMKPDPLFFETIMKAEGFSAAQTFFTDDKIENCEAAAKLGINTHHFTSAQKLFEDWSKYF